MYKWVSFKELRGLPRTEFAEELGKSCLAIWLDESAGFGTFPLEAMECKTPVIGKIPNMIPEWMESVDEEGNAAIKNNGVWTNTTLNIPELIATYMKVWLEDAVPTDLLDAIDESTGKYTEENQQTIIKSVYENLIAERKAEFDNILANAIKSEETEISTQN
jgi:glycosyltransferase involved in cell wall biosynthesis